MASEHRVAKLSDHICDVLAFTGGQVENSSSRLRWAKTLVFFESHHSLSTPYPQDVVAEPTRHTISCGDCGIRIQRSRAPFGRPSLSRGGSPCLRSKTSGRIATGAPPARQRPSRHTHHRGEATNPT